MELICQPVPSGVRPLVFAYIVLQTANLSAMKEYHTIKVKVKSQEMGLTTDGKNPKTLVYQ